MDGTADGNDRDRLRRHYEIERELADRLRASSKDQRRTLYGELYSEFSRRVEMPGNSEAQRAQVGLLLQLVDPFVEDRTSFLEVGAGSCDLSLALAQRVDCVWAVDAVDPALTPDATPAGFHFVPVDRVRDTIAPACVDVALSCHLVEHLHPDDLPDHLSEILDLLVEGGVYLVVTPNRIYGPHDISKGFSDRAVGLHLCEYTHHDLAGKLRRAGFADVRVIGRVGEPPRSGGLFFIGVVERVVDALPGRWRRALLSKAPRQAPFRPLEQVKLAAFKARPDGERS
jgi:SAM-dependent methyltransferase